jgi:hypothetical protein
MMYQRTLIGAVMAGGETWSAGAPSPNNETWRWTNPTGWTQHGNLPMPLDAMQYCTVLGIPIINGGDTEAVAIPRDFFPRKNITDRTYYLDLVSKTWQPLVTAHNPPPNHFGRMEAILNSLNPNDPANGIWQFTGFAIAYTNTADPNNIQFEQSYFNSVYCLGCKP